MYFHNSASHNLINLVFKKNLKQIETNLFSKKEIKKIEKDREI